MRKKAALVIMAIFFTVTSVNFLISYLFTNSVISDAIARPFSFELLTAAITFLIVGLLVSIFLSGKVIKPFKQIETQNKTIEEQSALLQNAHNRTKLLLDTSPQACRLIRRLDAGKYEMFECNEEAVKLFKFKDKQDAKERYFKTYPEFQPDGTNSIEEGERIFEKVFSEGRGVFSFTFQTMDGTLIPSEITMVRVEYDNEYVIAGYNRDLREFNRMMREIEYRDKMLRAGNSSATTLLSAIEDEKFDDSLLTCMGIVGTNFDVDRVQLWKNEVINGDLCFVHQYKWLSEFGKKKAETPVGTSFSYKKRPKWEKMFRRGEFINTPFSALSKEERDFLAAYEIKTVVIIPLFLQDRFWGLFTIDDCWNERTFTEDEIDILRAIGLMIASALLRREMTQNLHNASNAKSDFLANMSHEMRTPLNAVIGLTRLSLENSEIDEETSSNLEKVYNSGEMLLSIVNDILDISKIEAGRMALVDDEYDVPSLINDTITQNAMRIADKPIELKLNITADLFSRLYGDELRVKQILNNLLSNAIKYTNEGTVELSVRCEAYNTASRLEQEQEQEPEQDNVWVIIKVSDTGVGIRPEDIGSLFDDYAQLDVKENRSTEGTGLGLPITKSLAEMMGGLISVESEYGKGSEFTVRILQKLKSDVRIGQKVVDSLKQHHYSDDKRTRDSKIKRIKLPYARVLVVDDNPTNLDVAKGLMKPYGMQIDCVLSGQQAIDAIKNEKIRYNAIFMDHMMPGIDGIEATRIIREEIGTKYAKNIPIIALTANAIAGNESMFLSKGFQAFISKPVELPRLDDIIRHWVRDKEQEAVYEQHYTHDETDNKNTQKSILKKTSIAGLDIPKGIKRFSGDEETYLDSIYSYAQNTGAIIETLKTITEDSLDEYAIAVHGIKGSSYGICADTAGDMAAELEVAAKKGDYKFVADNNTTFIDHVQKLISSIKSLHEQIVPDKKKHKKMKPDTDVLKRLFEACKRFDTEVIDEQIEELTSYEYDSGGDLIAELYKSAHQFKYKEIRDKLADLFNKESKDNE